MTTAQLGVLETAQVAALSSQQIGALDTRGFAALTTVQLAVLDASHGLGLTTAQVGTLSTAELNILETAFVQALSTTAIKALSSVQIAGLTTNQIQSLSTIQFSNLNTAAIKVLGTSQVSGLTTAQLQNLTTVQVASLSTAVIDAFSMDQATAVNTTGMSTAQMQVWGAALTSPLVLDLNGDGVRTVSVAEGVQFALGADGLLRQTAWVSPGDGLLVRDLNGDGVVNDGRELFGNATQLDSGVTAADGFAALRTLDSNGDGSITSADAAFPELAVWKDVDSNGLTGASELVSLKDAGIAALHLDAKTSTETDNGNLLGLVSSYETTDGQQHDLVDVWLRQGSVVDDSLRTTVGSLTESLGGYFAGGAGGATLVPELPQRSHVPTQALGEDVSINHEASASPPLLLAPLADYYQRSSAMVVSGPETGTPSGSCSIWRTRGEFRS